MLKKGVKLYERALGEVVRRLLALQGVEVGDGLRVRGLPYVRPGRGGRIRIGRDVRLYSSELSNLMGVNHRVIIATMAEGAEIELGDGVGMSGGCILARRRIRIGNNVLLGANVTVLDNDMHPIDARGRAEWSQDIGAAPVEIGDRAWIGSGATILKGVTIGEEAVIGAGAVVTKDIPPRCIAAGVPARVVKELD